MLYTFCSFSTFALLVMQKCSQTEVSKPSGILLILSKSSMAFINWAKASLFNFLDPGRSPKGTRLVVSGCTLCLWILVLSIKAHQRFIFSHTKQSLLNNVTFSRAVTPHGTSLWLVGGLLQREKQLLGPSDISGILRHDLKWTTDVPSCNHTGSFKCTRKCLPSGHFKHASKGLREVWMFPGSDPHILCWCPCCRWTAWNMFSYMCNWRSASFLPTLWISFVSLGCSWEEKGTEICISTHSQGTLQYAVKLL